MTHFDYCQARESGCCTCDPDPGQITVNATDLEEVLNLAFWESGVEDRPVLDRLRRALEERRDR